MKPFLERTELVTRSLHAVSALAMRKCETITALNRAIQNAIVDRKRANPADIAVSAGLDAAIPAASTQLSNIAHLSETHSDLVSTIKVMRALAEQVQGDADISIDVANASRDIIRQSEIALTTIEGYVVMAQQTLIHADGMVERLANTFASVNQRR